MMRRYDIPLRIRLTDLPSPRIWGKAVRLLKTVEVLIFKVLDWLDLYRPQKSIVVIPSLATRGFTSLQAVVYNGTQEEVLGFKPRRLMHRILRGVPDLEAFERVRFQVSFSENTFRSVEASTETRGFIHLQLPWQLPWKVPQKSGLKVLPVGVETLMGCVSLGDYEVVSSPLFFLDEKTRWILISDIDDTIKDSNIAETTGLRGMISGLFRGNYYTYQAIEGMAETYQELAEQGVLVVYLTSTPYQLSPFLLKFLRDRKFPEGPVYPRWLGYGRFRHKWRTIHRILGQAEKQKCILVGDSGEQDLAIYRRICDNPAFTKRVAGICIRHVPGTRAQKSFHPRERFYSSVSDLKSELAKLVYNKV